MPTIKFFILQFIIGSMHGIPVYKYISFACSESVRICVSEDVSNILRIAEEDFSSWRGSPQAFTGTLGAILRRGDWGGLTPKSIAESSGMGLLKYIWRDVPPNTHDACMVE